MQKDHELFAEKNVTIIAAGPHKAKKFKKYFTKHDLRFYGVPDTDKKLRKLYKQPFKISKLGLLPALIVIGKDGKIKFSYHSGGMSDIPENKIILDVLSK